MDDLDGAVGRTVLALAVGDGEAGRRRGPALAQPGPLHLVLQALVLQPAQQERLVGLDVALVVLHPDGVEAVDDGPVQRGAPPAGRVEEPHRLAGQRPVEPAGRHGQRHVHEEVGQALVGLADVALDRGDVVVLAPERRGLQRPQQLALHLEHARAATDRLPSTASGSGVEAGRPGSARTR